jgi:hypothetical protein
MPNAGKKEQEARKKRAKSLREAIAKPQSEAKEGPPKSPREITDEAAQAARLRAIKGGAPPESPRPH